MTSKPPMAKIKDMKRINQAFPYANRLYAHRGVRVEQSGLEYVIWQDFVTARYAQLRCSSLAIAKAAINAMVEP